MYDPKSALEDSKGFTLPWTKKVEIDVPKETPKGWGMQTRDWGYDPNAKENKGYSAPKINVGKGGNTGL